MNTPTRARFAIAPARKPRHITIRVVGVQRVRRTFAPVRSVCLRGSWRLLLLHPLPMGLDVQCSIQSVVIPWKISSYTRLFAPSLITGQNQLGHAQQLAVRALARRYRGHGREGGHAWCLGGRLCATKTAELAPGSARGRGGCAGISLRHRGNVAEVFSQKTVEKGDKNTSISVDSKNPTGLVRFYFAEVLRHHRTSRLQKLSLNTSAK